jgi:uridine kinase
MKTALLISGYLRSFNSNIKNLQKMIISQFNNIDVYIHITMNENIDDCYLNIHDINSDLKIIKKTFNPICILYEPNLDICNDKKINNVINNWTKFFKLNQIKQLNEKIYGKYDLVIKHRPDLYIISPKLNFDNINNNIVYIPEDSKIDIDKLKNKDDKYICDMMAYGSSDIMNKYFDIYPQILKLIKLYGHVPETLLYKYLTESNIQYKLVDINYAAILSSCNIFAISGDSGTGKTTLGNILKQHFMNSFLLECDRYHKWERHDKKWDILTHLNPKSNHITKMKKDIFNLKLGKSIYQVDYDHINGKFTEKTLIKPTNNIVVCGLHSLYARQDFIYDFKIFMDVDDRLKLKWKIDRDVKLRGYDENAVIKQINKRKSDFKKFIYPQRNKSDMIINFYTTNGKTPSLKLFIKNDYNISIIINKLNFNKINYTLKKDGHFICFMIILCFLY